MDSDSRKLIDDLDDGISIIEVDWRPYMEDVRTSVGIYHGFEVAESRGRNLIVQNRQYKRIWTADIVAIRLLNKVEA